MIYTRVKRICERKSSKEQAKRRTAAVAVFETVVKIEGIV
jgi:hypothetical protein